MAQIFALYKGDTNLCDGTVLQIAKFMNLPVETVRYYGTPTYQKRSMGGNRLALVRIDEDDDD